MTDIKCTTNESTPTRDYYYYQDGVGGGGGGADRGGGSCMGQCQEM